MTARRVLISGRVQGVGYRDWMIGRATMLGVSGWVCNRPDGTVEALVAGDADTLAILLRDCRRGPRWAEVAAIAEEPAEPPLEPGFRRLKSA